MLKLQLYSRPQCHLCEILMEEIAPLVRGVAEVELVDISEDPDLMRRYGLRIPVLSCGSEELSAFPLNAGRVREFLATHVD
jgi:hypothetical protein